MYAYAKENTKPQISAHNALPSENEILEQLRFENLPKDDLKTILDKIKLLNPKLPKPHLLVAKYRTGTTANDKSASGAAASQNTGVATQFSNDILDGALYLYATSRGALYINSLIRKEKGLDIDVPDPRPLAREARLQFEVGENPPPFAPGIDIKNVIKTLSKEGNAIAIMNQAAKKAKASGVGTYFRGTKYRSVLNTIKPGALVKANFFMSVTSDKKLAQRFASGKYNTSSDPDELGVIYDITGNPKDFKFGDVVEKESIFPVGTKFKYLGRSGTTYRFVEQTPAEAREYKGSVYRLYR